MSKETLGFGCLKQRQLLETEEEEVLRRKREKFDKDGYHAKIDHIRREKE